MMNFKTEFKVQPFSDKITYQDKICFLGSCFAENISSYFERLRFQTQKNPFGILYHPTAIRKIIETALNTEVLDDQIFNHNGVWSHFIAHSALSSPYKEQLKSNLTNAKKQTKTILEESDFIFISLGTAWVYKYIEKDLIVNNCHKLPQRHFEKNLMTFSEVNKAINQIIQNIHQVNTQAKLIFTLSPVRHLKDGFIENQRSKSTLHLAIQNNVERHEKTYYFPSYELLLDDLRDYRFYENDFVHPNELALNYIWAKLKDTCFSKDTLKLIDEVEKINKRLNHRAFNPDSKIFINFKDKTKNMIEALKTRHPEIIF